MEKQNGIENFDRNAGKVWVTLDAHGPLTQTELMDNAGLNEDEFYAAVGWLAKENKICGDGIVYRLGETNLSSKIGKDALKIWNILDKCGEVDVPSIANLVGVTVRDAYSALGWLAKEEKVKAKKVKPK